MFLRISKVLIVGLIFGSLGTQASVNPVPSSVEERKIKQPVDHKNPQSGYYEQNVQILKPKLVTSDIPVVFFLGSEAGPGNLEKMAGPFQSFGPIIAVQADHRGYGSFSKELDQSIPAYVTMEQAIDDFHQVISMLKSEYSGSILLVGYSYSATLAIMLAAKYPEDAKAVYASSATVQFPVISSSHDEKMRSAWSPELYQILSKKIQSLGNPKIGQSNYQDELFLQTVFVGSVQYEKFRALMPYLEMTSALPTAMFLKTWKAIDKLFAKGMATIWATGQSTLKLSLAEAKTMKFNSRYWSYQQCNELGSFFTSTHPDSIFPQTFQDYSDYCVAMFGTPPKITSSWNIQNLMDKMTTPIVVVNGANDPWLDIQINPNQNLPPNSQYFLSQKGFHCPDREDSELENKAISSLLRLVK